MILGWYWDDTGMILGWSWDDPGMLLCNVGVLKTVQCTTVRQQWLVAGWLGVTVKVKARAREWCFSIFKVRHLGVHVRRKHRVRHPGFFHPNSIISLSSRAHKGVSLIAGMEYGMERWNGKWNGTVNVHSCS